MNRPEPPPAGAAPEKIEEWGKEHLKWRQYRARERNMLPPPLSGICRRHLLDLGRELEKRAPEAGLSVPESVTILVQFEGEKFARGHRLAGYPEEQNGEAQ